MDPATVLALPSPSGRDGGVPVSSGRWVVNKRGYRGYHIPSEDIYMAGDVGCMHTFEEVKQAGVWRAHGEDPPWAQNIHALGCLLRMELLLGWVEVESLIFWVNWTGGGSGHVIT